jgi:hypothetical protein
MTNLHTFIVRGSGRFPVSMLRFDSAWPFTDEDANKIEQSFEKHGRWEVTLQTCARHAPTEGRWESFNCTVEMPR